MSQHDEPAPGLADATAPHEPDVLRIARLSAYFRANRDRFTSEALKRAAATAGYSAAEIEAAWSEIGWGSAEVAAGRPANVGVTAGATIAFLVGVYVVTALLGSNYATSGLAIPVFLLAMLGGIVAWALLRESNPALARGIGCGVVLAVAVPVVLFLVLLGLCLAMGYSYGR